MLLSTEYHIQGNNGFVLTTNVHTYICKLYAFVFVSLNFKRTKKKPYLLQIFSLCCCTFVLFRYTTLPFNLSKLFSWWGK